MNIENITLLTAVDANYIEKLEYACATWFKFKPEIAQMPRIVVYDNSNHDSSYTERLLKLEEQYEFRLVPWNWGHQRSQRERMLTALVFTAASEVKTPWYMKIDADTIATKKVDKWFYDDWFTPVQGVTPSFVSNPWGYTKPARLLGVLDRWGDTVEALQEHPKLEIGNEKEPRAYHSRIISWLFFGNTEWTKQVVSYLPYDLLPVPSQDTFLWYCAARAKHPYVVRKMKKFGWEHMGRAKTDKIVSKCRELLA